MNGQRIGKVERKTRETDIKLTLNLDGSGKSSINTGIPFMDHMLELFARHGFFDLEIEAKGDLHIDAHHTMEDLGLVFGEALSQALGERKGIVRYGSALLPMDETLIRIALDLSNRPYLVYNVNPPQLTIKDLNAALFHEFFTAFVNKSGMNLHIDMLRGEEVHHVFEGVFKALSKALSQAVRIDSRIEGTLSTKGSL